MKLPLVARAWLYCALAGMFTMALVVGGALAMGEATLDHAGGTYGFSAGSDTHYCSAEWKARGLATVLPMVSCESAS